MPRFALFGKVVRGSVHLLLLIALTSACVPDSSSSLTPLTETIPTKDQTPAYQAEIEFLVELPDSTPQDQPVYLSVLDDVTGLALNPQLYPLEADDESGSYRASVSFPIGSLVNYRYALGKLESQAEFTPADQPASYRTVSVLGSGSVRDRVFGWKDDYGSGQMGILDGFLHTTSEEAVAGALVSAGGITVQSNADGSFRIENLPVGEQLVSVISPDGAYQPYQQFAIIADGSTTPARIELQPSEFVQVTFVITAPEIPVSNASIRLIGNLYQLGNMFTDLGGTISTMASRAPVMDRMPDGSFVLTLDLPIGFDLRYKYSLGDGFWNAEHTSEGAQVLRQLVIPEEDIVIEDSVAAWGLPGQDPVLIHVSVPPSTPVEDVVSIQLNPAVWTPPLPMWPENDHEWTYAIYQPMRSVKTASYRYCRNDQCGLADDLSTSGESAVPRSLDFEADSQELSDTVPQWSWWQPLDTPPVITAVGDIVSPEDFVVGFEFTSGTNPSLMPHARNAYTAIQASESDWIVLRPTWQLTQANPPQIQSVLARDGLMQEWIEMADLARSAGLTIAVFPEIKFPDSDDDNWWLHAQETPDWWNSWFEQYQRFILHQADLANLLGADVLIIGDPEIAPALPIASGENNQPNEKLDRWLDLIQTLRKSFEGQLAWATEAQADLTQQDPLLFKDVDLVYLLWSVSLASTPQTDSSELAVAAAAYLDTVVFPWIIQFDKPLILAVEYPAIDGASVSGCGQHPSLCDSYTTSNVNGMSLSIDLYEQASLYDAVAAAISQRSWVSGLISRGFNSAVTLRDGSSSVYGKPAWNVLWFWFQQFKEVE